MSMARLLVAQSLASSRPSRSGSSSSIQLAHGSAQIFINTHGVAHRHDGWICKHTCSLNACSTISTFVNEHNNWGCALLHNPSTPHGIQASSKSGTQPPTTTAWINSLPASTPPHCTPLSERQKSANKKVKLQSTNNSEQVSSSFQLILLWQQNTKECAGAITERGWDMLHAACMIGGEGSAAVKSDMQPSLSGQAWHI